MTNTPISELARCRANPTDPIYLPNGILWPLTQVENGWVTPSGRLIGSQHCVPEFDDQGNRIGSEVFTWIPNYPEHPWLYTRNETVTGTENQQLSLPLSHSRIALIPSTFIS